MGTDFIISIVGSFIITVLILRVLIPKLKSLKLGQKILDIGPRWHKSKEGTPTMGGVSFIIAVSLSVAAFFAVELVKGGGDGFTRLLPLLLTYIMALLNGLIGFFDDRVKLLKKQNEGFSASQKFLLQLLVAALYIAAMRLTGCITTELAIPFFGVRVELGIFYYVIALLLITGIVNSANLTDGIDGLVSSITLVIMAFFAVCAFRYSDAGLTVLSGSAIGGMLGFLVYNFHPARVFMGDTGSLFLGGLAVGCAFLIDNPLIILFAGLIYLIEAMSDIIQVGYYKLTHRRVFLMAPIHHHFEKCGWSEVKVVAVFSAFTLLTCGIALAAVLL